MSGPFKMKYTKSQGSAFPFKENPLKMYGGMKASPVRNWWSKMKDAVSGAAQKGKDAIGGMFGGGGGGDSMGGVPSHGPESHRGGGGGGGGGAASQEGPLQNWRGGGGIGNTAGTGDMGGGGGSPQQWRPGVGG